MSDSIEGLKDEQSPLSFRLISGLEYTQAIQNLLIANATMHPAYGTLIFIARDVTGTDAKEQAFAAAADSIIAL